MRLSFHRSMKIITREKWNIAHGCSLRVVANRNQVRAQVARTGFKFFFWIGNEQKLVCESIWEAWGNEFRDSNELMVLEDEKSLGSSRIVSFLFVVQFTIESRSFQSILFAQCWWYDKINWLPWALLVIVSFSFRGRTLDKRAQSDYLMIQEYFNIAFTELFLQRNK